MKSIVANALIC